MSPPDIAEDAAHNSSSFATTGGGSNTPSICLWNTAAPQSDSQQRSCSSSCESGFI